MRSMQFKGEFVEALKLQKQDIRSLAAIAASGTDILSNLYDVTGAPQNWMRFLRCVVPLLKGSAAAIATYTDGESSDKLYALYQQQSDDAVPCTSEGGPAAEKLVVQAGRSRPVLPLNVLQHLTTLNAPMVMTAPIDRPCLLLDLGFSQALIGLCSQHDDMISYLVIGRHTGPAFSLLNDLELQKFLPHIARSLHLYMLIEKLSDGVNTAAAVLDRLPVGIAFFNQQATCLSMNESARHLLKERHALLCHMQNYILTKSRSARHGDRNRAVPQVLDLPAHLSDHHQLLVTLDIEADGRDSIHTVFFIINPDQKLQIDSQALCRLFHLTAAEARVATLIANGTRLDDVATELEISLNTVRTHLRHIFEKTGVERQADLILLLLRTLIAIRTPYP
ncbi:MAG TPA: helix-turn-helix transcriptional regulator [Dongiaceae bacterium]